MPTKPTSSSNRRWSDSGIFIITQSVKNREI
jgi:hypothetical protein